MDEKHSLDHMVEYIQSHSSSDSAQGNEGAKIPQMIKVEKASIFEERQPQAVLVVNL